MCTDPDTSSLSITNGAHPLFCCLLGAEVPAVIMSLPSPIHFAHVLSQHLLALALLTPEVSHLPLDEDTPTYSQSPLLQ